MNENEIAAFAAKVSAFRAGLNEDERIMLDRVMLAKSEDGVEAHSVRAQNIAFNLEDGRYALRGFGFKDNDTDDVSAHGY